MAIRETRIFAPNTNAYGENWYQNILGRIIKPFVEQNLTEWIWFTQYSLPIQNGSNYNAALVTNQFLDGNMTRSVMVRYSVADDGRQNAEDILLQQAQNAGCLITDFRDWDMVADTGSGRHIGGAITNERQERRARRNVLLYNQISLLTLDVLDGPDGHGNYKWEDNVSKEIPTPPVFICCSSPYLL